MIERYKNNACLTWAGSHMWARLNPAHMPKEVEAVVLETTALNYSCTLNLHERDGDRGIQHMFCRNRKISEFFLHRKPKGVRTVEEIPVLVIGVTH